MVGGLRVCSRSLLAAAGRRGQAGHGERRAGPGQAGHRRASRQDPRKGVGEEGGKGGPTYFGPRLTPSPHLLPRHTSTGVRAEFQ